MKVGYEEWQPHIDAVANLRALRGVDVTAEVAGLVRNIRFKSDSDAKKGEVLLQLNADSDIALLHSLEAAAALATTVYKRDEAQFAIGAISNAILDGDAADLKSKRAQVEQQMAIVEKKMVRAPFSGRLGITTINPGQYLNAGDKIVTLQSIDVIYADFFVPQQQLSGVVVGQRIVASTDAYPNQMFEGRISAINPQVDAPTRNVQIESTLMNTKRKLLPGMFVSLKVETGSPHRYLTLPQTAVSFNPYGATVYIVEKSKSPDGHYVLTAKQSFITTGDTRGDQVAILSGLKNGDIVVSSGQLKLKNGSTVIVNNKFQPSNNPLPQPIDQ
jgi:membrane fusion protein (multidrug efflux system)